MLEKIQKVDWVNLKHAYGSASDVPNDIQSLTSPDKETRANAIYRLYGNIFHQGTRYEATPYAIPFLLELLTYEEIKEKHEIIKLLLSLALGYENEYLPSGINPKKFRKEIMEDETNMTVKQREECEKYGYSPIALIDCYNLVKEGIPTFWKCFKSQDIKIRKAAIYATSWFPEESCNSIPKIKEALQNLDNEFEIANAILTIGLLNRQSEKKVNIAFLYDYLTSKSALIRICSAIALADNPMEKEILKILIEGINDNEKLNYLKDMHFNEGRIVGYASMTLSEFGKREKERIIPVMCKALETVNAYGALDITSAILSIINDERTIPIKDERLEDLNSLDIKVLNAIYEYGGWEMGIGEFVNYFELLRSAGIPNSKKELGIFLNKI